MSTTIHLEADQRHRVFSLIHAWQTVAALAQATLNQCVCAGVVIAAEQAVVGGMTEEGFVEMARANFLETRGAILRTQQVSAEAASKAAAAKGQLQ